MELSGKLVVITGAGRGIGAAAAHQFASAGARVALLARSAEQVQAVAASIGPAALALPCDIANFDQVARAVSEAEAHFGPTEVLINNAGIIEPIGWLSESDPQAWAHVVNVNLVGAYHCARAVLPGMAHRKRGKILAISSETAREPFPTWSPYCASKAGAAMLTRMIDHEHRADGIRAIGLSPGAVATDMLRDVEASEDRTGRHMDWSDRVPPDWPARALL